MDGYFSWTGEGAEDDIDRIMKMLGDTSESDQTEVPKLEHLDHEVRTAQFWGSLDAEQLHYIRVMMLGIAGAGENVDPNALYHLGYAESLLRFKFGLCPRCMKSHETNQCYDEVMSSKRGYRAACDRFNVTPEALTSGDFASGSVTCRDCGSVYDTLAARMVASGEPACPGCTPATAAKKI
jgi:hypothetical protein